MPENKRPWYRLHAFSWVVLLLASAVMILIVVPGERYADYNARLWHESDELYWLWLEQNPGYQGAFFEWFHGWPLTYLHRGAAVDLVPNTVEPENLRFNGWPLSWSTRWAWRFDGEIRRFYPLALLCNVLVTTLVIVCVAGAVECFRRRRGGWFRFRVIDALAVVLVACAMLTWWTSWKRGQLAEADNVKALKLGIGQRQLAYRGPLWLRRLVGTSGPLNRFYRTNGMRLDAGFLDDEDWQRLSELRYLETLELSCRKFDQATIEHLSHLPALSNLVLQSPLKPQGSHFAGPWVDTDFSTLDMSKLDRVRCLDLSFGNLMFEDLLAGFHPPPNLESLDLAGASLTLREARELVARHPEWKIQIPKNQYAAEAGYAVNAREILIIEDQVARWHQKAGVDPPYLVGDLAAVSMTDERLWLVLPALELESELVLGESTLTPRGLEMLMETADLYGLDLGHTPITDAHLEVLVGCPRLKGLSCIQGTASCAAFEKLLREGYLEWVEIYECNMPCEDVGKLFAAAHNKDHLVISREKADSDDGYYYPEEFEQ